MRERNGLAWYVCSLSQTSCIGEGDEVSRCNDTICLASAHFFPTTMGKTSRKKKQQHVSREEANAAAGQIVRIGEKEKCSNCKNWVKFGFTLRLGNPPHRAQCGPNAKCVS